MLHVCSLQAEEEMKMGSCSFTFSLMGGFGVFEKLEVRDVKNKPYYYHKKPAFPIGFSVESCWPFFPDVFSWNFGMSVGISKFSGYFGDGEEVCSTEKIVTEKHFFACKEAHAGFFIRKKVRNIAVEFVIPVGNSLVTSQAIVIVRDTLTEEEFYKLNYDETFIFDEICLALRFGKHFRENVPFLPWFNVEVSYKYMWNRRCSEHKMHRLKLIWRAWTNEGVAAYLFTDIFRGNPMTYTQVGFCVSFGI